MKWFIVLLLLSLILVGCPQPTPPASKPTISTFSATPATLEQGSKSTLSWQVNGADTLTVKPDNVDVTGKTSLEVSPFATTTYTLTATNTVGNTEATTVVTVNVPPLEATVNPVVIPPQPSLPDGEGNSQPVGASRDKNGVQSEFIVGQVLVRPKTDEDLQTFLQRYEGTIMGDDTIPEPPTNLGITLTAEQRKATRYLVNINLAKVDGAGFAEDAAKVGMGGLLEMSSQEALLTLAGATDALAEGFSVSPNYIYYPSQTLPIPLFRTNERPSGGGFTDAFSTTRFQSTGSQSNVTLAWQFVAAHGIQRRAVIAIIDEGFWLDTNGNPRGTDSDFPTIVAQYDFLANDPIADGPGTTGCGGAVNTCRWHGTGSTGVAAGAINNSQGDAGTGGLIADVMLFKRGGTKLNDIRAVRTAVAWGADVVSMSFSGDCDSVACRKFDRENFNDTFGTGSKTVFVAAAGNGDSSGNGYNTGDPSFVHPCIEDHVICVGALNDNLTTKIGYSNFGRVSIFAPTNIPVMSQPAGNDPNPNGPSAPRSFGGTSAATPFVAGVAAMIKAINPELNSDQVNQILRDTAHKGVAPVDFYIDAYAAVRKAAEGIDGTPDRFESTGIAQLTGSAPWTETNLNLHNAADHDNFQFEVPQRSSMTIEVAFPEQLGIIPLNTKLQDLGSCGAATFLKETGLEGGGSRATYTVPPGPYLFNLGGGLINAYNLKINLTSDDSVGLDDYEINNTVELAKHLYTLRPTPRRSDFAQLNVIDPKVTINATLHNSDVDYYIVRGVTPTLADLVLLGGQPIVRVDNNEAPITLEVFALTADKKQGALVGTQSSQGCFDFEVRVNLESDKYYLVKVSGGIGNYRLYNGILAKDSSIPGLAHDRAYEVLHPLERITDDLRNPEIYVFTGDRAVSEINVKGQLHMELYSQASTLIAEGQPSGQGFDETLGLGSVQLGQVYALKITPKNIGSSTAMSLSWGGNSATRSSSNLILNPGAEDGPGNDTGGTVPEINNWGVPSDNLAMPTVSYYNSVNGLPGANDPGPDNRGNKFFAGGPGTAVSGIQQQILVNPDWVSAIDNGFVKFDLSAFLGGNLSQTDDATLTVRFLDANFQEVGKVKLGPITPREREDKTGLFAVAQNDYVPAGTRRMYVDLEFRRDEGDYNDGYADSLELTFSDYTQ
jgi:Subtilase family